MRTIIVLDWQMVTTKINQAVDIVIVGAGPACWLWHCPQRVGNRKLYDFGTTPSWRFFYCLARENALYYPLVS